MSPKSAAEINNALSGFSCSCTAVAGKGVGGPLAFGSSSCSDDLSDCCNSLLSSSSDYSLTFTTSLVFVPSTVSLSDFAAHFRSVESVLPPVKPTTQSVKSTPLSL